MDIRAIERNGTKVKIIDQTKLPGDLIYRDVEDWLDMILAIRRLEVRGAPAIGIAAAYCLAMAAVISPSRLRLIMISRSPKFRKK